MWRQIINKHFPGAVIEDAALKYPITEHGWDINFPDNVDTTTFLVLQDMLTWEPGTRWPRELEKIAKWLIATNSNAKNVFVLIWNYDLAEHWNHQNPDSFTCIQFSIFQYQLWEQYTSNRSIIDISLTGPGRKHNALCLNRIDKPHRRLMIEAFRYNRSINCSDLHSGKEPYYPGLSYNDYEYNNLDNLISLAQNYNTSRFSIVTESQYYEPRGIISEKTFNAIVALHPFIIVGTQGSLREIRRLGFMTYDGYIDETYDDLHNGARINTILDSNAINKFRPAEGIEKIALYNKNYFFSEFGNKLLSDLELAISNHSVNV